MIVEFTIDIVIDIVQLFNVECLVIGAYKRCKVVRQGMKKISDSYCIRKILEIFEGLDFSIEFVEHHDIVINYFI